MNGEGDFGTTDTFGGEMSDLIGRAEREGSFVSANGVVRDLYFEMIGEIVHLTELLAMYKHPESQAVASQVLNENASMKERIAGLEVENEHLTSALKNQQHTCTVLAKDKQRLNERIAKLEVDRDEWERLWKKAGMAVIDLQDRNNKLEYFVETIKTLYAGQGFTGIDHALQEVETDE